ncbi:MAG: alpha-E domain-containing protein, partial [Burkholderiales bacterium]|nr:alpha-E domain-containing protein [Burkholderiales bacterium]
RTINGMMTLSGFALDGMTRDDGWRFLSIGRRLERLSFQCLALQVALQHGRASGLTWLLRLADSVVTYRTRYMARPEWLPVLDLLVLDSANPRSLRFQANGVYSYLKKLEDTFGSCGGELMRPCVEALDGLDPARDLQPENDHLRNTVDMLRSTAFALSDGLSHRFFSHAQTNVWATLGR